MISDKKEPIKQPQQIKQKNTESQELLLVKAELKETKTKVGYIKSELQQVKQDLIINTKTHKKLRNHK